MQSFATEEFQSEAYALLSAIDWHSRITLAIEECDGGAGWSRNGRRISVCYGYIERFEEQLGER